MLYDILSALCSTLTNYFLTNDKGSFHILHRRKPAFAAGSWFRKHSYLWIATSQTSQTTDCHFIQISDLWIARKYQTSIWIQGLKLVCNSQFSKSIDCHCIQAENLETVLALHPLLPTGHRDDRQDQLRKWTSLLFPLKMPRSWTACWLPLPCFDSSPSSAVYLMTLLGSRSKVRQLHY